MFLNIVNPSVYVPAVLYADDVLEFLRTFGDMTSLDSGLVKSHQAVLCRLRLLMTSPVKDG